MSYWTNRQEQLKKTAEKDEAAIKKRLSKLYDAEFKRLDKEIAAYYQKYGEDNVIEYRQLMESLPDEDKRLLMQQMDEFATKYPQYADLMPVRESMYKLDRLQGLQCSVSIAQANIAGYTNEQIKEYETSLAQKGLNYAMETLGFGKNFYSLNSDVVRQFVDVAWSNGENFSARIWNDTQKLAQYLNQDMAQGFARGDSYDRLIGNLKKRFDRVNRNDAYRLVFTEGTYVMAESTMQPFKEDFEQYRLSPVLDGRTCPICRSLREQVFLISERQPGVNFPPIHPWCRCTWEIAVDDWDAWVDDYVKKHGGGQEQADVIALRMDEDYQQQIKARRLAYRNRQRGANVSQQSTDFDKMDRNELARWAQYNLKTDIGDLKGVNLDYARDTLKVISKFERKMGGNTIQGLKVKFGGLSKDVYAKYDDATKTILLKKTGSKEAFEKAQKEANARYRAKWKRDKDYHATDTYTGTIWHELGHAIDIDSGQSLSTRLSSTPELDELSVKISNYAGTTQGVRVSKRSEAWAENFAAYMDGGKNKEKVPAEIAEMIENYFKKSASSSIKSGIIKTDTGFSYYLRIPNEKFTEYALNFDKDPNKARAFKEALGYTQSNHQALIDNIRDNFDVRKLVEKGDKGFGMRYSQLMRLTGANGKTANVMTAWIYDDDIRDYRLISAYVDKR